MTPLAAFLLGLTVGAAAVAVLWARTVRKPAQPAGPTPEEQKAVEAVQTGQGATQADLDKVLGRKP